MTDRPRLTVAVTGASGYVGSILCRRLGATGHDVIRLVRRPAPGSSDREYDLGAPVSSTTLHGVDALVHCAYDLAATSRADIVRTNIEGTLQLFEAAVRAGVNRSVLISSMSAYPGTTQLYGTAKLRSESDVRALGGTAIRLGLVYGPNPSGMAGSLRKLGGLPVVPLPCARSELFLVHEDDMGTGLTRLLEDPDPPGLAGLAHPVPVRFDELLHGLSARPPRTLRVPWQAPYAAMRVAEGLGLRLPLRADSLLGLARPAPAVPRADYWASVGLVLRPWCGPAHDPPSRTP
jgi:nucleoside-diphosphate-sugar epimerase